MSREHPVEPGPERLRRIETVYHTAREHYGAVRAALLDRECAGDDDLRLQVVSLLDVGDSAELLDRPALETAGSLLDELQDNTPAPGSAIGPYQVEERIGAGGMGAVYKCLDTRLHRPVAIKVVRSSFSDRFLREARAIAALNHPNICTLHDIGPDYLVLEFLEGETLAQRLTKGPLPAGDALRYGIQVADALWSVHSKGFTHGDLKPQNLMLTKAGMKILDFGLARTPNPTPTGQQPAPATRTPLSPEPILGTPAYMAPEQLAEKPWDHRSDIFSLGLVLYEMHTGRRPFTGRDRAELAEATQRSLPDLERIADARLAHVLERCLAKDPDDRWQTARDVQLELQYLCREVDPADVTPAKGGPSRRLTSWAVAAAAVLVAAIVGVYFSLIQPDFSVQPLTSYPGSEESPSFSPDGSRVAFSWDGPAKDNQDIYVKQVGPGDPVRLTTTPATDGSPRWSPDGNWIAFLRRDPGLAPAVYVIPALGGAERRLLEPDVASGAPGLPGRCLDWSPDGRWLLTSIRQTGSGAGLALVSFETGEVRPLTRPPLQSSDSLARFAPDGSAVAFLREGVGLLILPLSKSLEANGAARAVPMENAGHIRSVAWTENSRELVVAAGFWQNSWLWRVPASGGEGRRLSFGEGATYAEISRRGGRLAYSKYDGEWHIWSLDLAANSVVGKAEEKFTSSRSEVSPSYSPDGKYVAFGSNRSGNDEIWVCGADGGACSQLTSLTGVHAGSPAWSPDGNWIAFDVTRPGEFEINVVKSSGGKPTRLAAGTRAQWSRDGRWIYYQCAGNQICRVGLAGGTPTQIGEGWNPQESPDGNWLYHLSRLSGGEGYSLQRKSLIDLGSPEENVATMARREFLIAPNGIWYESENPREPAILSFLDLKTRTSRVIYETAKPAMAGLALSPNGARLLFTQVERNDNLDLMLVEHFR